MSDGSSSGSGSASSTRGWAWLRYASAGLVAASTFVMAQSDWEEINVYPMLEHTLEAPFSYDGGLENWLFSGATIPQVQKIALVPPVAERHGIMWHRTPVITNDLEFQAQIDVKSVPVAPSDEGFGFFYVADNLNATFPEQQFVDASSWTQAMTDFGFNNGVGYKKRYKGLGVFFTVDSRGLGVVSGQVSDGNEDVVSDVFGTRQIVNFDWRRAGKFTLYVRVGVDVEVSIRQPSTTPGGQETVTKVMFAPAPAFDAGASVGFTAWSGTKKGVADQHDAIAVTNVAAWDHDLNKGYVGIDSEFDWEKGVHSQTDQREAIEALTASINRHINELLPKEEQMMQDIYTLQDRVQRLHDDVTFFSTEVQYTLGKGDAKEHIQQLKDHVGGFKNILSKTASEHHAAADDLHQKAKGGGGGGKADHHSNLAQKMLETNKGLHEKLASQNSTTKWFIVFLFGAIIAVGVAFYQKMRHYEKKHFM